MYCCDYYNTYQESKYNNFHLRLFPALLSSLNSNFKFEDCSFKLESGKQSTGRIVCFKEFGIRHSFTLESSFYGRTKQDSDPEDVDLHFSIKDYKQIGVDLAKTLEFYINSEFCESVKSESNKYTLAYQKASQAQSMRQSIELLSESIIKLDIQTEGQNGDKYSQIFNKVSSTLKTQNKAIVENQDSSNISNENLEDSEDSDSESDDELTNLISQNIQKLKLK